MSVFFDITRPLHPQIPVWPGDRVLTLEHPCKIADGEAANGGHLHLSLHTGTHVDAPFHFVDGAVTIDEIPVDAYVGPAQVIDMRGEAAISIEFLAERLQPGVTRLLLHTGCWSSPDSFPQVWPLADDDVPAWLAERGVKLIGLDAPSVDEITSSSLPRHHLFNDAGLLILENLLLDAVHPGTYELIALPLRLKGGDGSPVRAVLRA